MSQNLQASELAIRDFATVPADAPLSIAMQKLIELQADEECPRALIVLEADGRYAGMLSARLLLRVLVGEDTARIESRDDEHLDAELLAAVRARLERKVREVLLPDLPHVSGNARLLDIVRQSCSRHIEFLPVVDDGKAIGMVPVTAIFQAAADLALTPEDEGIRFDEEDDDS